MPSEYQAVVSVELGKEGWAECVYTYICMERKASDNELPILEITVTI